MRRIFFVIGCIAALAAVAAEGPEKNAGALQVGVASAAINPAEGTFLGGYDNNRRCTGVHDNLYLKAVIFANGNDAVALVVADSLGLQYDTVQAMRTAAAKAADDPRLPPERILVQATHSHCSPDTAGIYGPDETHTGRDPVYMAKLAETAAEQVRRALQSLQPARLVWAETQCKGWAVNDSEPNVLDNSVTILQCQDVSGKPVATLTHFACHPTVLDGDTTLASADWAGAFYKKMGESMPGEHLFLQGAVGCWIQPETPERTFALAEKYGNDLAGKTLAALKNTQPVEGTDIRFAHKVFQMPIENPTFQMMSLLGLVPRPLAGSTETESAWFAVGSAQFATHLGETAPLYSNETKALMKTGPKFVLGLGLDHLGYICPPAYFDNPDAIPHAKYLTGMSPGPKAGPAMMDVLKTIIP